MGARCAHDPTTLYPLVQPSRFTFRFMIVSKHFIPFVAPVPFTLSGESGGQSDLDVFPLVVRLFDFLAESDVIGFLLCRRQFSSISRLPVTYTLASLSAFGDDDIDEFVRTMGPDTLIELEHRHIHPSIRSMDGTELESINQGKDF